MKLAGEQIAPLLEKAEHAESTPLQDGFTIPAEIKRSEDRITKLREATQGMEQRAAERLIEEQITDAGHHESHLLIESLGNQEIEQRHYEVGAKERRARFAWNWVSAKSALKLGISRPLIQR